MIVNNGELVEVSLSDFTGRAALVIRGDAAELAYLPNVFGGVRVKAGDAVSIDDKQWEVTEANSGSSNSRNRVLTLKRVDA